MTLRTIILGSAACVALAAASPSFAQGAEPTTGPQYSTPEEHQQTEQLNAQYQNGTTKPEAPAVLNGNGDATSTDMTNTSSDQDQYQDRNRQYQQQQQDYQNQRSRYEQQRRHYQVQRDLYLRDISRYNVVMYDYDDYPRAISYRYDNDDRLVRLYLIAEPSHQLARAPVEDPSGRWVGHVRNVETAPDGRPARLEIALNRRVSVWVSPGHFRFDPDDHVLFTDLTRADLWNMPGATYESGDYDTY